ncbi:MAG: adenine-specific methyltransferase EcoRI family protein [Bacteroidales bacterium]|nr:adenine-specific methyltransferase EcoRI family protein [Bacteroidales bacterium]
MANNDLKNAKKAKKDEFYTQLVDIELELKHYKDHFKGKTVLCNCDDPRISNFFHYFSYSFEHLGLKKLITTCYKNQSRDLFSKSDSERAIWLEYNGDKNGNRIPDPEEIGINYLKGDGDFRSPECIELLKQADIVVTNPPFSLFREYVAQLIEYNKKFIIIGNVNAISYKEIFQLIKNNKLWLGASIHSGDREFGVPTDYPLNAAGCRQDENGNKYIRVKGVRWFTNLDYKERHEDLILYKMFNAKEYPKYENYDAINVDITNEIPSDYYQTIGVPITFLDKYNPDQFEIEALGIVGSCDFLNNREMEILDKEGNPTGKYTFNAKGTLYRKHNPLVDKKVAAFKDRQTGELYQSIYARILIRRKQQSKLALAAEPTTPFNH